MTFASPSHTIPYHPLINPCTHTHIPFLNHSDLQRLTKALRLPADGCHTRETSCGSDYALLVTLNYFSFPRQQRGHMEDVWHMDRRKISA